VWISQEKRCRKSASRRQRFRHPIAIKEKIFQPFFTTKPTGSEPVSTESLAIVILIKVHGGDLPGESNCRERETEYDSFLHNSKTNLNMNQPQTKTRKQTPEKFMNAFVEVCLPKGDWMACLQVGWQLWKIGTSASEICHSQSRRALRFLRAQMEEGSSVKLKLRAKIREYPWNLLRIF